MLDHSVLCLFLFFVFGGFTGWSSEASTKMKSFFIHAVDYWGAEFLILVCSPNMFLRLYFYLHITILICEKEYDCKYVFA